MKTSKIIVDGVEREISLGISEEEIERNEENLGDTIDLRKVVEEVNDKS